MECKTYFQVEGQVDLNLTLHLQQEVNEEFTIPPQHENYLACFVANGFPASKSLYPFGHNMMKNYVLKDGHQTYQLNEHMNSQILTTQQKLDYWVKPFAKKAKGIAIMADLIGLLMVAFWIGFIILSFYQLISQDKQARSIIIALVLVLLGIMLSFIRESAKGECLKQLNKARDYLNKQMGSSHIRIGPLCSYVIIY